MPNNTTLNVPSQILLLVNKVINKFIQKIGPENIT